MVSGLTIGDGELWPVDELGHEHDLGQLVAVDEAAPTFLGGVKRTE
jgi:hypothetical protein